MAGYIKLFRGWDANSVFRDEPLCQRAAWVWLLERAAWKDTQRRDPHGNLIEIKRGQLHTSNRTLGAAWGWSKNKAERFLRDLETCHMVDRRTDHTGVLLTITNYEKFQGERVTDGRPEGSPVGSRTDHTRRKDKNKEIRNKKTNKENSDLSAWSERLPSDLWGDFKKHRAAKRAPITATALKGIEREAAKAGISFERAIRILLERGWTGFKAEWHNGEGAKRSFKQR